MIIMVPALSGLGGLGDDLTDPGLTTPDVPVISDPGSLDSGITCDSSGCSFQGLPMPTISTLTPPAVQPPSTPAPGMTPAQQLQLATAAANAATGIVKSTQSPYVIPGTPGTLYNPQTGQILGSTAAVNAASIGTSLAPVMMMGIGLVVLLIFTMGGKK